MEFRPEFADAMANAAMGWYTNCLSDGEFIDEIQSALRRFGYADLVLPDGLAQEILLARRGTTGT